MKPIKESQDKAKTLGLKFFRMATPCKRGHTGLRYTSTRQCVECVQENTHRYYTDPANKNVTSAKYKRYYEKNKEKRLADNRQWHIENRKSRYETTKSWRKENAARFSAKQKEWWQGNPEKVAGYNGARRSKTRGVIGSYTAEDVKELLKLQKWKCAICRIKLIKKYHVDHVIPLKSGGSNERKNIQVTCQKCNLSKGAKHPIEFMQALGRLL